jgi:hypothetical protein
VTAVAPRETVGGAALAAAARARRAEGVRPGAPVPAAAAPAAVALVLTAGPAVHAALRGPGGGEARIPAGTLPVRLGGDVLTADPAAPEP